MSANSFPPPHRLGVLMSPAGRFLECSNCHLSFDFPYGERFVTIAKQFDAQLCRSSIPTPGRIEDRITDGAEHRRFVIVRYEGQVPMMASCTRCLTKFFTPATMAHEAIEAERYLFHKYHLHRCYE
jgi:hypothetical protein